MVGTLATAGVRRCTTCRSRAQPTQVTCWSGEHRRVRRRVGDPDRRDAAVGARPRARRARAVLGRRTSATPLADLVRQPRRRRSGPTPSAVAEQARLARASTTATRWPALQQALGDPEVLLGAVRVTRAAGAASRASTPPSPRSSATPTGSSTRSPCGSSAATRCGSPRPCAAGGSRPSPSDIVRRAAARHPPRRRPGRPRQGVRAGRRRPRRRAACAPLLERARRDADPDRGRRPRAVAGPHRAAT